MTKRAPVVAVTRDERGDGALSQALAGLGAEPVPLQTIALEPASDMEPLRAALRDLFEYDWVVFTSAHAVDVTCAEMEAVWGAARMRPSARVFDPARVAAVGPRTAARLAERGVAADLVAAGARAASLVAALADAGDLRGARVLWPCSDIARPDLRTALAAAGARVTAPAVYRTVPVRPPNIDGFLRDLRAARVDAIVFLSPSSARALAAALPDGTLSTLRGRTLVASIGPATTEALVELGAEPAVEPGERSAAALAAAVVAAVQQGGARS